MKIQMALLLKRVALFAMATFGFTVVAQEIPADYQQVISILGKKGDYKENVLKVNLPRNDLTITVAGVQTPTPFGFGGWLAMTKGEGGMDVMMGDLPLRQEEVNPIMTALLTNGLEVTALHNHFFWEEPRIFYMHVHGHGEPGELARKVKPALDLMGKVPVQTPPPQQPTSPNEQIQVEPGKINTETLEKIIGHKSDQAGAVVKFTIGRDDLQLKEMGAVINSRMGLNTWAAFIGTDAKAAIAGDIAMLNTEVTPVLKALRQHDLNVVAIHQHMIGTAPEIIFLHYWGTGPAQNLATGFKAALDELGRTKTPGQNTTK